jgi:hypothetical protein
MVGYGDAVYVMTPLFWEGWWLNTSRNIRALFCHNHGSILGKFPALGFTMMISNIYCMMVLGTC